MTQLELDRINGAITWLDCAKANALALAPLTAVRCIDEAINDLMALLEQNNEE